MHYIRKLLLLSLILGFLLAGPTRGHAQAVDPDQATMITHQAFLPLVVSQGNSAQQATISAPAVEPSGVVTSASRAAETPKQAALTDHLFLPFVGGQDGSSSDVATKIQPVTTASAALGSLTVAATKPISYQTFAQATVWGLYPYTGTHIALLAPSPTLEPSTIKHMVTAFDRAYEYYRDVTEATPTPDRIYKDPSTKKDLLTIAVLTDTLTCVPGCGNAGYTGIQIAASKFISTYPQAQQLPPRDDETIFYELGRNFWFYGDPLAKLNERPDFVTGYAIFMRFMSMGAAQVAGAPFGADNFATFKAKVQGLLPLYLANPSLDATRTMTDGLPGGSGADFIASFLFELRNRYGDGFVNRFLQKVKDRKPHTNPQTALDNFVVAASAAAGENLTDLFGNEWRWPISTAAKTEAQDSFGAPPLARQVFSGPAHSCATTAYQVLCWGQNSSGQLGDGSTITRTSPVPVIGLWGGVTRIVAGAAHTCALVNGKVFCWGDNRYGQVGDGTNNNRLTPVAVTGLTDAVITLAAGSNHTCALTVKGEVYCWGQNSKGQLGDKTQVARNQPTLVANLTEGVLDLATGAEHTCALTNAPGVKCWGANQAGQLGDNTTTNRLTPTAVVNLTTSVSQLKAGDNFTCVNSYTGIVSCWGDNRQGQLGDGTVINRLTPVTVTGLGGAASNLTTGGNHSCVLVGGAGKCWGANQAGQLGDGTTINRATPVAPAALAQGFVQISAGGAHTCARGRNKLQCWGQNVNGQLGDGSTTNRLTPTNVNNAIFLVGVPHNFAGDTSMVNPNTTILAGEYGNLTGDGSFGWQTGTSSKDVATNGFAFMLNSGDGNDLKYSGVIYGAGNVSLRSAPASSAARYYIPLILSGNRPNQYTGVTILVQGVVSLTKPAGVTAIPGDLVMNNQGPNDELKWGASDQIADNANLTINSTAGKLNLNGNQETVYSLRLAAAATLDTGSANTGQLTVQHFWYNGVRVPAGTYTANNLCFVRGGGRLVVLAAPHNFSGEMLNPNTTISAGKYGNLTGDGSFGWQTGTSSKDVETNGFAFTLNSGDGNPLDYSGAIYGAGSVSLRSAPAYSSCCAQAPLILSGSRANQYTGVTTLLQGVVRLAKQRGVTAIPGDLVMNKQGANDELQWGASDQIVDSANLIINSPAGKLNLNDNQETVYGLRMVSGATIDTGSTGAGQLTVQYFLRDNKVIASGTYTVTSGYVKGGGRLVVKGNSPVTATQTNTPLMTNTSMRTATAANTPMLTTSGSPPITIPALREWTAGTGAYTFSAAARIIIRSTNLVTTANVLADDLHDLKGYAIPVISGSATPASGDIVLSLDAVDPVLGSEGYLMTVGSTVAIRAQQDAGAFYGTRTLLQLLKQNNTITGGAARDWPSFAERSLMVDNGRKYFTANWLKRHIKDLAYLKYNYFHFHLSDDQGFHLESTTVTPTEPFLTKEELTSIIALATRYHVTIVPEIDMPGHMGAILPQDRKLKYDGKIYDQYLDIITNKGYDFAATLIREYIDLFPGPYWHMGGDELHDNEKPNFQKDMQNYMQTFVNQIDQFVTTRGKHLRIWGSSWAHLGSSDPIKPPFACDITLELWDTSVDPNVAISQGYAIMNSSFYPTYYVQGWEPKRPQYDPRALYEQWTPQTFFGEDPAHGDAYVPNFNPFSTVPLPNPKLLGGKFQIWSDNPNVQTEDQVATNVYEKLRAMAQNNWGSPKLVASYTSFAPLIQTVGRAPSFAAQPGGTPHNFAGAMFPSAPSNTPILAGEYGNLTGDGSFGWQTGTSNSKDVAINGFVFTIDSGAGNDLDYSGVIYGAGSVRLNSAPDTSQARRLIPLVLSGSRPNQYTGVTTLLRGVVKLNKLAGVTAIPGDLVMNDQGANDELQWGASDQIADSANLTINSTKGKLNLNGFQERVYSLRMVSGATIDTGSTSAGQLTVQHFWSDNKVIASGTYTATSGYVKGGGRLVVLP